MKTTIINYFQHISVKSWVILFISFLTPIHGVLLITFLLIFADFILGIKKSIHQGKKITSRGLFATGKKIYLYNMIIISSFVFDYYFFNEFVQIFFDKVPYLFTKLITLGSVSTELWSIHENIEILYKINIVDRVKKIVKSLFNIKKDFDKYQND
jgi:hypothetical protein